MNLKRILVRLLIGILLAGAGALGVRTWRALQGPALQAWQPFVPEELSVAELDAADWPRYLAREQTIFTSLGNHVTQTPEPGARVLYNRYVEGSQVYPPGFAQDWNRSYMLEPQGAPRRAARWCCCMA
jgi:hypothetical protein